MEESEVKVCAEPDCEATVKNHYWGAINAQKQGWFSQRDGTVWCPKHVPEWIEAWRESR